MNDARRITSVRASRGDSFEFWMRAVDRAYMGRLGMGADDGGDATWRDYYDSDLNPLEAMAAALIDWQDGSPELLEDIGLNEYV